MLKFLKYATILACIINEPVWASAESIGDVRPSVVETHQSSISTVEQTATLSNLDQYIASKLFMRSVGDFYRYLLSAEMVCYAPSTDDREEYIRMGQMYQSRVNENISSLLEYLHPVNKDSSTPEFAYSMFNRARYNSDDRLASCGISKGALQNVICWIFACDDMRDRVLNMTDFISDVDTVSASFPSNINYFDIKKHVPIQRPTLSTFLERVNQSTKCMQALNNLNLFENPYLKRICSTFRLWHEMHSLWACCADSTNSRLGNAPLYLAMIRSEAYPVGEGFLPDKIMDDYLRINTKFPQTDDK